MTIMIYSVKKLLSDTTLIHQVVKVQGWVKTRRDSKAGVSFVALSDGSCQAPIQLVVPNTLSNYEAEVLKLTAGCSLEAEGMLIPSTGKGQSVEIQVNALHVFGLIEEPENYPISPKHHTLEYLREQAHLRPRTNVIGAVMRVRDCLAQAVHRFFHEQGFYWIHTPIITCSDCEGAGAAFRITTLDCENLPRTPEGKVDFSKDFFGKEAFLTVSGQLHVEAYCLALSKVYTFGPIFRAEQSNTPRHLAEVWMIEPEIAFANLPQIIDVSERLLKYVINAALKERLDDLEFFVAQIKPDCIERLEHFMSKGLQRIDYTEAIKILEKSGKSFEFPVRWGMDLQAEHERYLASEYVKGAVAVMNYPKDIKAFYMRVNEDGKTVAACDLLFPEIGELVGGSQREERLEVLVRRMKEMKLDPALYHWYLDLRRYGTVPHAGFGVGFDRLVRFVTGMDNLRDVIPFPRAAGQALF